jgi:tetratricopeptide (TPR) repeat protein
MTQIGIDEHYQRALILHEQKRHAEAERELRQGLALEPSHAGAHALLALSLAEQERWQEATDEANAAVGLAPDFPFAHYARANVLLDRGRLGESREAIAQAIALDAYNPAYFALLAGIELGDKRWSQALAAADQGLAIDPEHARCVNLRAMALVKLGRRGEAGAAIDAALERDPLDAVTHANQGWALLHANEPRKAMEHFREALRLQPDMEWARAGIVEALKAHNPIYRVMLAYFLWMSRLRGRAQWAIIIGGYVGYRLLFSAGRANPQWGWVIWPVVVVYIIFALLTWMADPLFNLLLRLDRFGRYALSRRQIAASNVTGGVLLAAVAAGIAFLATAQAALLLLAIGLVLLLLPVSGAFKAPKGWPQGVLGAYAGGLALVLLAIVLDAFDARGTNLMSESAMDLLNVYVWGVVLYPWVANVLIGMRVRR